MGPSCCYRGLRLQRNYERSQGDARGRRVPEIRSVQGQTASGAVVHLLDQPVWRRSSPRTRHQPSDQRKLKCISRRNKTGPRTESRGPLYGNGKQDNIKVHVQGIIPIIFDITICTLISKQFVMFYYRLCLSIGTVNIIIRLSKFHECDNEF